MKRYDCVEEDNLIKRDKEFIAQVDEAVRIERAKDRKEIESLKRKNELLIQTIEHSKEEIARLIESYNKAVDPLEQDVKRLNVEIARLRKAVQEIEYLADRITIENGSIARAILKLAREALEGKYAQKD
jgi:methyl-accepting chemotaxis protein